MDLYLAKECLKDLVTEKTTIEQLFQFLEQSYFNNYESSVIMYLVLEVRLCICCCLYTK